MSEAVPRIGVAPLTPDAAVIAWAEETLAKARSGEIRGVAHITYLTNSETAYGLIGDYTKNNYLRTYAMLHWLAGRAMHRYDQTSEDVGR